MAKYRKKPVVIDAVQFDPDNPWPSCVVSWGAESMRPVGSVGYIETLEGKMSVQSGDWIICGVKGEWYPCKPDVFEASYERAE